MYKSILAKTTTRQELAEEEICAFIKAIAEDKITGNQIAGFQVALLMKGTSLAEISAFAKAMRDNCVPICPKVKEPLMDAVRGILRREAHRY